MPKARRPKSNGEASGVADPWPDRTGRASAMPTGEVSSVGAPRQLRPILTLFASSSSYVLRLDDTSYTPMALAIAKEIKSGSLIVVTPTDTKVFDLGQPSVPAAEEAPVFADRNTPTTSSVDIPASLEEYVQGEAEGDDEPSPIIEPEFQESRVRHRDHTVPADNSICGRCNGTGTTLAGGGCPVCGGRGTIIAWGRGSHR